MFGTHRSNQRKVDLVPSQFAFVDTFARFVVTVTKCEEKLTSPLPFLCKAKRTCNATKRNNVLRLF